MKLEVERLINTNLVKYETLVPIVNECFATSNATHLNLYVDLYSVLKILYSNMDLDLGRYNVLASTIINIGAHYRHFFRTRYKTEVSVYFIYGKNIPYINNQFYRGYNKKAIDSYVAKKSVNKYIDESIDTIGLIIDYLPDMYLLKTDFETSVLIYDLMCRTDIENKKGHLVLSKDPYTFQLVAMKPDTVILRTKRDNQSFGVDMRSIMYHYLTLRKSPITTTFLDPGMLTLLETLTNFPERNVKSLLNTRTAIKILEDLVKGSYIINGYNSASLMDIYSHESISSKITNPDIFTNRFKALDVQFQHLVYLESPECLTIPSRLINKDDPVSVRSVNDYYFKDCPIDIMRM